MDPAWTSVLGGALAALTVVVVALALNALRYRDDPRITGADRDL